MRRLGGVVDEVGCIVMDICSRCIGFCDVSGTMGLQRGVREYGRWMEEEGSSVHHDKHCGDCGGIRKLDEGSDCVCTDRREDNHKTNSRR